MSVMSTYHKRTRSDGVSSREFQFDQLSLSFSLCVSLNESDTRQQRHSDVT